MEPKTRLEDGIDEADPAYALLENLLLVALVALGWRGMQPLLVGGLPLPSLLYAAFALVMLGVVLRKHLCTRCCYYGKWCHCGWGKLAAALFEEGSGDQALGGRLALLTWGTLMGLPIVAMAAAALGGRVAWGDGSRYLLPFVALVAVNGVLHVKDCRSCRMRSTCPGSAAKV